MTNLQDEAESRALATQRRLELERLYLAAYPALRDAAFAEPSLDYADADTLVGAVARLLHKYTGPYDDLGAFTAWASAEIVKPGAARVRAFHNLMEDYRLVVLDGLWAILRGCSDLGIESGTIAELENLVWSLVFWDLDAWLAPGISKTPGKPPASLATRLRAFARSQALGWRTERIRNKRRFVRGDLATIEERIHNEAVREAQGRPKTRPVRLGPGDVEECVASRPGVMDLPAYERPIDYASAA